MSQQSSYGNEEIAPLIDRLSLEQKLELLDWHPIFTGRCPNCEMPIRLQSPPQVHWDCEACAWKDDSI